MEDKALATRVILVRHGESSFNVERRIQGHLDKSTLTDKGIADAQSVGQSLKDIPFNAIYHSPLTRARDTAAHICQQLQSRAQPQILNNLIEISLPLWEGILFTEVKERDPQGYDNWHHYPEQLCMEIEGESGPEQFFPVPALYEQARQVWEQLLPLHDGETILLVGHSGINRALLGTALGLTPERYHSLQQANCNISVLNFTPGQPTQLESLNLTDHTGLTFPKPRQGYEALRLLLVRHGETDWNRQGKFQGQIDVPLNENGRLQGQQAADFLQETPIDFAVSSSMLRPKETAELILAHHPTVSLSLDDQLREISHGKWEGCLESEIERNYPGELERWQTTPAAVQMPDGENIQQVWDRAVAAWDTLVQEHLGSGETGLVVAHDAVNKVILCYLAGLGPEHIWSFKQGNGAVSVIDYTPGGKPTLAAMNITTHLGGVLDQTAAGAL
ncbi:MAG: histidine phosphatase family protein [Thermosynechococcaceae cyanobacterium]